MSKKNIKARVLVDCTINGTEVYSGSVVSGDSALLKPHIGESLDGSAAAVKFALSENDNVISLDDVIKVDPVDPPGEADEADEADEESQS